MYTVTLCVAAPPPRTLTCALARVQPERSKLCSATSPLLHTKDSAVMASSSARTFAALEEALATSSFGTVAALEEALATSSASTVASRAS